MSTGLFVSYRTKTLTMLMKTCRKVVKSLNIAYTMLLVQEQISQKYGFHCALMAVLG